jgi:hypothetical protein
LDYNTYTTWLCPLGLDIPLYVNWPKLFVRRSECAHVRNTIIVEEHEKLKAAVTKGKAILSGERAVLDGNTF